MDTKLVAEARQVMKQFEAVASLAKMISDAPGVEQEIKNLEKRRESIRAEIAQVESDVKRVWGEREKAVAAHEQAVQEAKDERAKAKEGAKELLSAAKAEGEKIIADARAAAVKTAADSEAAKKTLEERQREIATVESQMTDLLAEIENLKKRFA